MSALGRFGQPQWPILELSTPIGENLALRARLVQPEQCTPVAIGLGDPADPLGHATLRDQKPLTLSKLERMGEKSVNNLLEAIERSKARPLWRLLFGAPSLEG